MNFDGDYMMTQEDYKNLIEMLGKERMMATWLVAAKLRISVARSRKMMKMLEELGYVKRHKFTSVNNIVWEVGDTPFV